MNAEKLRSQAIIYIKSYHANWGKVPSVQKICDEISGLNRANFYKLFKSISEACEMAGVPIPLARIAHTRMASKKRSEEKTEPIFSLTEEQYKKINAISYLEMKSTHEVIDGLIENDRILRQRNNLTIDHISNLSKLLIRAEKEGLNVNHVLKILNRYTSTGIQRLNEYELNIIDDILKNFFICPM